ncbi:MAG: metallophosphoesterase [Methylibium sp. NZG]|nr:MAG: metallophosphoesterase [Methylibium sp. NZG]
MSKTIDTTRRELLALTGKAGLTTLTAQAIGVNLGLVGVAAAAGSKAAPFDFAIIADPHLYSEKDHVFDKQLEDAVAQVNAMPKQPDFVMIMGDVSHHGELDQIAKGKQILSKLKAPIRSIPGEHDWYLDMGKGWTDAFGPDTWSFDHKGVHFIGMNSILVPDFWTEAKLTPAQRRDWFMPLNSPVPGVWGCGEKARAWLAKDVAKVPASTPVVIFTHSPLWDYYPRWNFQVSDHKEIRGLLSKFKAVTAFHGHVHHTVYNRIGNLTSIGTMSTSWPWPYPPIKLPFPEFQQYRADPGNTSDGMGSAAISMDQGGKAFVKYQPFADSLPPKMKNGFKV